MEKEYDFDKENPENNMMKEPAIEYGIQEEMEILPLTEEELKNCMTGEEFIDYWCKCIDKVFDK